MTQLQLQAAPPEIEFIFKHMSQSGLNQYVTAPEAKTRTDAQTLADILAGWPGVEAAFTPENLQTFTDQYAGAARAIFEAYVTLLIWAHASAPRWCCTPGARR